MEHLKAFGFFIKRFLPFWYVCLMEKLASVKARSFDPLFLKSSDILDERWDPFRRISYLDKGDILAQGISAPIANGLEALGMLHVGDGKALREVGVVAALKSKERKPDDLVPQGMHADTSPFVKWENEFCISTITAGTQRASVEIYPESFDGGKGSKGVPVRVDLEPGETIVFNGLARHRGVSYEHENVRFFVSFVVPEAVARSKKESFDTTSRLEKQSAQEAVTAISFDEWKMSVR